MSCSIIKTKNFTIQAVFKICSTTISHLISDNCENDFKMFIDKLVTNISQTNNNNIEDIYKTKICWNLTSEEIIIYASLAFFDSEKITVSTFLKQLENEILSYSVIKAIQRLEYLTQNRKFI